MTMEVLAAEFPDIFHQFIEIVPDPNKPDQQIYVYEENINQITSGQSVSTVECKTGNKENVYVEVKKEISADKINDEDVSDETEDDFAARAILQEYDYDQIINKDANKNMTSYVSKNQAFKNTTFSHDTSVGSKEESTVLTNKVAVVTYEEPVPSPLVPTIADTSANLLVSTVSSPMTNSSTVHSPMTSSSTKLVQSFNKDPLLTSARYQDTFAPTIDDVEDILADLVTLHSDVNSNIQLQLDTAKSGYGCSWSYVTNTCLHGLSCPFTAKILDLDQVSSSVTNVTVSKQTGSAPGTKVHNVVVLKQTPHGLVKVPESMVSQHHLTRFRGMQSNVVMAPNMQAVSYR